MSLPAWLADAIEERLDRAGDFGRVTITKKAGRVAELEVLSTERVQAGEAA